MLESEIAQSLRVGKVARVAGGSPLRPTKRPTMRGNTIFAYSDLERVSAAFIKALAGAGWPGAVNLLDLRSGSRIRQYSDPRMCLAMLLRELTGASFPAIAGYLGGRHHTTVMHACERGAFEAMHRHEMLTSAVAATRAALSPTVTPLEKP